MIPPPPNRRLPEIIAALASCSNVTLADIRGPSQLRRVTAWRAAVIVILRSDRWTVQAIGRTLNRHHSTVLYHTQLANRRARFQSTVSHEVAALAAALAAREREEGAA